MVLAIPVHEVADIKEPECMVLTLQASSQQIKELFAQREKVRLFLSKLSTNASVTNAEAIAISTEFYLRYAQSSGGASFTENFELKKELMTFPNRFLLKYPVSLQLTLPLETKTHIEKNLSLLFSALKHKYRDKNVDVNNFLVLTEVFSFVLENCESIKKYFDTLEEPSTTITEETGPPPNHAKCCAICGTEINSPVSESMACMKCLKFFENSKISEINSWTCKNQSGYCALIHNFQYKDSILFYRAGDGVSKPYASNCNVLCKKCRFNRCEQVGLKRSLPQKVENQPCIKECIVCCSKVQVNDLQICSYCQMFLSDSVEESSHHTISCMRSSDCEVHSQKTSNFSACPGCWMDKIKLHGILDAYLRHVDVEEVKSQDMEEKINTKVLLNNRVLHDDIDSHESFTKILEVVESVDQEAEGEEEKEEVKCVVCYKVTVHKYQNKSCCGSCKKFFLKCAKSRCFKDFCCSGSSKCEVSSKTSCSHCWWGRCVKSGLYKGYQLEGKVNTGINGVKRPLTSLTSQDFMNKRDKFEDQELPR